MPAAARRLARRHNAAHRSASARPDRAALRADILHAKPSALDERALAQLTALETLTIDHNSMRYVPASFGNLTHLLPGTKSLLGSLPTLPGDSWSQTFQSRNIMGWVLNFSALQIPSVNFPLYLFYLREVY